VLKNNNIKFQASLVGDGPLMPDMVNLSSALDLDRQVKFLGKRTDIAEILSKHNVFVLTSNWEGFPLSILEAMRAGLPVVASDVGGVRESVIDNVTGFLIPKGNVHCLAERLQELNHNVSLRNTLGLKGRQQFRQYFTAGIMMKKVMEVYDAIVPRVDQAKTELTQKAG
jgi:glycosyltransferase involved in cell wall biosynthesis